MSLRYVGCRLFRIWGAVLGFTGLVNIGPLTFGRRCCGSQIFLLRRSTANGHTQFFLAHLES